MFNNYPDAEKLSPCRVDPEEMLQNARRCKEKTKADIEAFMNLGNYRINDDEAAKMLGFMTLALHEAERDEQRWLDEIDKD